eukprot:scaffold8307_cov71-Phaeocystis_antarctica.AAC.2
MPGIPGKLRLSLCSHQGRKAAAHNLPRARDSHAAGDDVRLQVGPRLRGPRFNLRPTLRPTTCKRRDCSIGTLRVADPRASTRSASKGLLLCMGGDRFPPLPAPATLPSTQVHARHDNLRAGSHELACWVHERRTLGTRATAHEPRLFCLPELARKNICSSPSPCSPPCTPRACPQCPSYCEAMPRRLSADVLELAERPRRASSSRTRGPYPTTKTTWACSIRQPKRSRPSFSFSSRRAPFRTGGQAQRTCPASRTCSPSERSEQLQMRPSPSEAANAAFSSVEGCGLGWAGLGWAGVDSGLGRGCGLLPTLTPTLTLALTLTPTLALTLTLTLALTLALTVTP